MSASLADLLTAAKNIVTALNNQTQTTRYLAGQLAALGITTPTLVYIGSGRLVAISYSTPATVDGVVYDSDRLSDTSSPMCYTALNFSLSFPFTKGILVVPAIGQVVSLVYSTNPTTAPGP